MSHHPPVRKLRPQPDLDQLKRQAKELLQSFLDGDPVAVAEVNAYYHGADPRSFALHQAQLVFARSHGFESWPKLKSHVDGITVHRLAGFVRAGDIPRAQALLKLRPELANMAMSYGDEHRPIHFAVMNRLPEMTRLLMQHGADARAGIDPHRDATTAATLAAERGFDEIVEIIETEEQKRREALSAPEAPVSSIQDDLSGVIAAGDEAVALSMLQADPALAAAFDRDGNTPLHIACAVRHPALVNWLLQHGAAPNQPGKEGRTPFDLAAMGRRRVDPEQFAAVARLLRQAGAALTPCAAAALGEVEWLRARHAEGRLANPITWGSGGLLTIAVRHNQPEVLTQLLDFGFDPDERIRLGEGEQAAISQAFPLWHCAALGRREMAEILIARGASLNQHVDSSGSPVYSAFSHRQWEMVELLTRHGGIVGPDTAAIYRQTDLARKLLEGESSGALPEGVVSPGHSVAEDLVEFGCSGGAPEIVRMALPRIDWPRDDPRWFRYLARSLDFWNHIPWLYAANQELDRGTYIECFRLVLARCNPNVVGGFGRTVLHEVAAMDDHVTEEEAAPFAQALLEAGAQTGIRDEILRSTPLGWACRWGRFQVARILLEHGADPMESGGEPWARPRAWAEKMGHASLVQLLAGHGG
ncbi:ankyrin repeat domain-containing protein [Paludibaculum fermentans]|uniref:Ankyrin repeat domain-containing protein n=1 Tax=Paludibaculum fermentans TaxID=1473598 RepID=A0A7S7SMR7_PALFE|nr:ankyrin repeat domain-containing protein [Paludibaculum fermentans]QOY90699.1 ankyrin repeat domain-containing protein [Paludibaculum fermentans]